MFDPVDTHVGKKIRFYRLIAKMSQKELAGHVKITFQQIQKYEKGFNRVCASRLFYISRALNRHVSDFFADFETLSPGEPGQVSEGEPEAFLPERITPETVELLKNFNRISAPKVRRQIVGIVKSLAAARNEEPEK